MRGGLLPGLELDSQTQSDISQIQVLSGKGFVKASILMFAAFRSRGCDVCDLWLLSGFVTLTASMNERFATLYVKYQLAGLPIAR